MKTAWDKLKEVSIMNYEEDNFKDPFPSNVLPLKTSTEWIQTFTGKKFFPLNPRIEDIDIVDIAHSLSNICRFNGHIREFYSVANHSILVSYLCDYKHALYGLLHDASEFAISDISSPIKRSNIFDSYRVAENKLQTAIYNRFGLFEKEPEDVKVADFQMLATEARDLMGRLREDWIHSKNPLPFKIEPLSPKESEKLFLKRFYELYNGK